MKYKTLIRFMAAGLLLWIQACATNPFIQYFVKPYFETPPAQLIKADQDLFEYALSLQLYERVPAAIRAWDEFIEKHPRSFEAHNNLGLVYFEDDQVDQSIISLETAMALEPSDRRIKRNLVKVLKFKATVLEDAKNYNGAVDALIRAQEISTGFGKTRLGFAIGKYEDLVFEQAKQNNTMEAYEGFIKRFPDSKEKADEARMKIEDLLPVRAVQVETGEPRQPQDGVAGREQELKPSTAPDLFSDPDSKGSGADQVESAQKSISTEKVVVVATIRDPIRVRKAPSLKSRILTFIKKGARVPFIEEKGGWFNVEFSSGQRGWVSKKYARLESASSVESAPSYPLVSTLPPASKLAPSAPMASAPPPASKAAPSAPKDSAPPPALKTAPSAPKDSAPPLALKAAPSVTKDSAPPPALESAPSSPKDSAPLSSMASAPSAPKDSTPLPALESAALPPEDSAPLSSMVSEPPALTDSESTPAVASASPTSDATIDLILGKLEFGNIAFNAPRAIKLDEKATIQLSLGLATPANELQQMIEDADKEEGARIRFSDRMEARLSSPDFLVRSVTPEMQGVTPTDDTEWNWEVKPKSKGRHKLNLTVSVLIDIDGVPSLKPIRTFQKEIEVEVTPAQQAELFIKDHWHWVGAAILIPIGTWLLMRKKKSEPDS